MLLDYSGLSAPQSALFVYDPRVAEVCRALERIATEEGISVTRLSAERDWTNIQRHLAKGFDTAIVFEFGASHHTQALIEHLSDAPDTFRAYRLFGATANTIRFGFRRRRSTLRRRNWNLIMRARKGGSLMVENALGSRLEVGLDPSAPWTNTYGECADGYPGVFPPSEVNTRSLEVDGLLVVDGAIGSNIGWPIEARLNTHPVSLRISRGRIIDVDCRHKLTRDLIEEFLAAPHCNEVVEIGIGTNDGIPRFVSSDILINERYASFHLGVGSADLKNRQQNLHLDFILADCQIALGAHVILKGNEFFLPDTIPIPDWRNYDVEINLHDAL